MSPQHEVRRSPKVDRHHEGLGGARKSILERVIIEQSLTRGVVDAAQEVSKLLGLRLFGELAEELGDLLLANLHVRVRARAGCAQLALEAGDLPVQLAVSLLNLPLALLNLPLALLSCKRPDGREDMVVIRAKEAPAFHDSQGKDGLKPGDVGGCRGSGANLAR
jgi:hypothetical protein